MATTEVTQTTRNWSIAKYRVRRIGQRHPWARGVRRKHCYWAFNGDGQWPERIKGWWKRYWVRWERRELRDRDA